jgi:hypothetical protein
MSAYITQKPLIETVEKPALVVFRAQEKFANPALRPEGGEAREVERITGDIRKLSDVFYAACEGNSVFLMRDFGQKGQFERFDYPEHFYDFEVNPSSIFSGQHLDGSPVFGQKDPLSGSKGGLELQLEARNRNVVFLAGYFDAKELFNTAVAAQEQGYKVHVISNAVYSSNAGAVNAVKADLQAVKAQGISAVTVKEAREAIDLYKLHLQLEA